MDELNYPQNKADLERCDRQLTEICCGNRDLATMSVPPKTTDFDMQFSAAFDELKAYRDTGLAPEEITPRLRELAHGYWMDVYMSSPSSFVGTCSRCKVTNDIPAPSYAYYCPNCGARMDSENPAETEEDGFYSDGERKETNNG